ncbi:nucleotidyltransferase domain-containing protein [Candidatus Woesearchaeota archaeon]|nr:nucleotidyltransferase domain-containing protein [Candidatus Woesearchaeota archaeon]
MITKNIKTSLKEYFFLNPTIKLRVRQIERKLSLPLPSVIRYTKELEEENILKSTEIANIRVYSGDRNSKTYIFEKKMFNLCQLYTSGLLDFLIEQLNNPVIVVFGSYALGEDIENSDIDLYLETAEKKKINLQKYEQALQRKIQIFKYKNINDLDNKELANNIINGITLNGFLEVL